jgi:hypothetical protein
VPLENKILIVAQRSLEILQLEIIALYNNIFIVIIPYRHSYNISLFSDSSFGGDCQRIILWFQKNIFWHPCRKDTFQVIICVALLAIATAMLRELEQSCENVGLLVVQQRGCPLAT